VHRWGRCDDVRGRTVPRTGALDCLSVGFSGLWGPGLDCACAVP
jgi:hypothetical protein